MTIQTLIDQLQQRSAELGPDCEVRAWQLAEAGPLDQFDIASVRPGWDELKQKKIATIYLVEDETSLPTETLN